MHSYPSYHVTRETKTKKYTQSYATGENGDNLENRIRNFRLGKYRIGLYMRHLMMQSTDVSNEDRIPSLQWDSFGSAARAKDIPLFGMLELK